MSSLSAIKYLTQQKQLPDKIVAAEWKQIEKLYREKLWNELTIKMITFIKHPSLQNEDSLVKLYHNFIQSFEMKINPYGLVQMVSVIVHNLADKKKSVEFLEQIKGKVKQCDEAAWYCWILQGLFYLEHLQDLEATKAIIDDLKEVFEVPGNVTPVHGKYFLLASQYYRRVGQNVDYYRCGLQFLGCALDNYPKEEWPQQIFSLGLATLLGDGNYNIGELLSHPALESLINTENACLVELLKAFNSGNIKLESLKQHCSESTMVDLVAQEILYQKIKNMKHTNKQNIK